MTSLVSQNDVQEPQTIFTLGSLHDLEKEISQKLGPSVLDYTFVFAEPEVTQIARPKIDEQALKLLSEYVDKANAFTEEFFNKKIIVNAGKEFENFMDAIHDIYMIRYLQAKSLFAEYELIRIPTYAEIKLWEISRKTNDIPNHLYRINVPEAIVVDETGDLDIQATEIEEIAKHTIKKALCIIPESDIYKDVIYNAFDERTSKPLVLRFYNKEITKICENTAAEILEYMLNNIYDYIDKGYLPNQAKENTSGFLKKIFTRPDWMQNKELGKLISNIRNLIAQNPVFLEEFDQDIMSNVSKEYLDTIVHLIQIEGLSPTNLYKLNFREPDRNNPFEKDLNYIIDTYLLSDDGTPSELAVETYSIDLSKEAKTIIFDHVTGGMSNNKFNLDNYLYNIPDGT